MLDMEAITLSVKKGAHLLDEQRPGWALEVDLGLLDMNNVHKCVLGQTYGDYWTGRRQLSGFEEEEAHRVDVWSYEHGFDFIDGDGWTKVDEDALERGWTEAISDRLTGGGIL